MNTPSDDASNPVGTSLVSLVAGTSSSSSYALSTEADVLDAGVTRLDTTQALEPGHYWTAIKEVSRTVTAGDTLLLLDIVEFEDQVHSVQLRVHPRHGDGTFTMMVDAFLDAFVPCQDAEAIRQREQQAVMNRVTELQTELMQTQSSPQLMIEAVRSDVEELLKKAEQDEARVASNKADDKEKADRDLAKIHRRASRRSAAKGNPLAVPRVVLASEVGDVIAQGIDAAGVAELTRMAGRQAVVAQAQGNWLKAKTTEITETLKALTPYMTERAAVALARSSGALKMVKRIQRGIESLDLYTGTGVDVFDVCTGEDALSSEPLTLIQGKRYAEEELAAWADVASTFDFSNKEEFFKALAENTSLRDQVLPAQRCVVTMAMTRHSRQYSDPVKELFANIQNKLVFLLVRNGDNVHVVYSSTPSHEGAARLFPTMDELERPFRGWDGSKVSIRDIEFGEGSKRFDEIALSYKRFLILLCGLDHRLGLLGGFYPPEEQMNFMTAGFQDRFFRFVADDESNFLIGQDAQGLSDWMTERNLALQSGSRVFVLRGSAMVAHTAEIKRRHSLEATRDQFLRPFIALKDGGRFVVKVHAKDRYSSESCEPKCELADENNRPHSGLWWLCVDAVLLEDVQRFRHSRIHRGMGVGYLRLLRRIEAYLLQELETEAPARSYLVDQATTHGGLDAAEARSLLVTAIRNWRAARRGAALPGIDDKPGLNEVLSLMVPEGRLTQAMEGLLAKHLESTGVTPLLLTRSGKSKLLLYSVASPEDRAAYPDLLTWGWVKRTVLEAGKTKLREVSSSLLWMGTVLPASETEIRRWSGLDAWLNVNAEPISLKKYAQLPAIIQAAADDWGPVFKAGKGSGIPAELFARVSLRAREIHLKHGGKQVPTGVLAIPVAATSEDGKVVKVVYLAARVQQVLWYFGNETQQAAIDEQFARRFYNKTKGREIMKSLNWRLLVSADDLGRTHDDPVHDGLKGASSVPDWSRRQVQVQSKLKDPMFAFHRSPKKKGEKNTQPLRTEKVELSLNRAFDELMGASIRGPKREFYRHLVERIKDAKRWGWNEKAEAVEAKVKALRAERYVHKTRAIACPLVWSAERGRSVANTHFVHPLRANERIAPTSLTTSEST